VFKFAPFSRRHNVKPGLTDRAEVHGFRGVTDTLEHTVIDEFAGLITSGFAGEMLHVLVWPGWHVRASILPRLASVEERYRADFAAVLCREGYDINVPGIKNPEPRPWD
jgi:hypothetical protein